MWTKLGIISMIGLSLLLEGTLLAADDATLAKLDSILAELQKIRVALERGQPQRDGSVQPTMITLDVQNAPRLGSADAPLTIVEVTDYECPYCKQFYRQTFMDLKRNYIDSQKVRFFVMDLPSIRHPNALSAAQAARCAGEQGQFWAMHDRLLSANEALDGDMILTLAKQLNISHEAFQDCIQRGKHRGIIEQDALAASNKGIQGTPAFVIGKSTPTGVEGELVMGAMPYGIFEQKLRQYAEK